MMEHRPGGGRTADPRRTIRRRNPRAARALSAACESLEVRQLLSTYYVSTSGSDSADGLSLEIAAGSFTAVTGPSGSGKSTLLHLIGAIEAADGGTIVVDGVGVTALRRRRLSEYRRTVGFVFQRYHLLPALTALDNVIAPVLPFKVDFDKR